MYEKKNKKKITRMIDVHGTKEYLLKNAILTLTINLNFRTVQFIKPKSTEDSPIKY